MTLGIVRTVPTDHYRNTPMRKSHGFQQPRNVVRAFAAWLVCYFVLAGLTFGQAAFEELPPDSWWIRYEGAGLEHNYSSVDQGLSSECFLYAGTVMNSVGNSIYVYNPSFKKCKVDIRDDDGNASFVLWPFNIRPQCLSGYTYTTYADSADGNPYTGLCKRPKCATSSVTCFVMSQTPISSVPVSACLAGCVVAQAIVSTQERFVGGAQTYFYTIQKANTASRCYVAGAGSEVVCNSGPPPPQDPCAIPGASTNPACGGGSGCPANSTVLANGACTPNDSAAPCPAASYRVDGQGACVPYPGGAGSGGGGSGSGGGGGTSGAGGASGSSGGAGGAGGAGSSTGGGGGGGSGGQGGGGGAGGGAGSGGQGGRGGEAGKGAECGPGKMLCEETFKDYVDKVKEFFEGDATEMANGKAEIAKARSGGYDENPMTKGPVTDVGSLRLDTGGGMIGGSHSCPAPRSVSFKGTTFALSFQPVCDFAGYIRFVLLAVCALVSARIVFGAWT